MKGLIKDYMPFSFKSSYKVKNLLLSLDFMLPNGRINKLSITQTPEE